MNQYDIASEIFKEIGAEASEKFLDYLEFIEASEQEMQIAAAMVAGLDKERCREQVGSKTVASMMKKVPDILFYMDEFFVSSAFTKIFRKSKSNKPFTQRKLRLKVLACEKLDETNHIKAIKLIHKTFSVKELDLMNKFLVSYEYLIRVKDKTLPDYLRRIREFENYGLLFICNEILTCTNNTNLPFVKSKNHVNTLKQDGEQIIKRLLDIDFNNILNPSSETFRLLTYDSYNFLIIFSLIHRLAKNESQAKQLLALLDLVESQSPKVSNSPVFRYYQGICLGENRNYSKAILALDKINLKQVSRFQELVILDQYIRNHLLLSNLNHAYNLIIKSQKINSGYTQLLHNTTTYYKVVTSFLLGKEIKKADLNLDYSQLLKPAVISIEIIRIFYLYQGKTSFHRLLSNLKKSISRNKDCSLKKDVYLYTIKIINKNYKKGKALEIHSRPKKPIDTNEGNFIQSNSMVGNINLMNLILILSNKP